MATHADSAHSGVTPHHAGRTAFISGWTLFASVLMIFGGLLAVAEGAAALHNDNVFVHTGSYAFQYDLTGWGAIHLALGVVIALAGFALMTRATWARVTGVVLAGLGLLANFLWLPYQPLWSIVLMAINIFVIWALCADTRDRERTT